MIFPPFLPPPSPARLPLHPHSPRYFNDLWEFDPSELKWSSIGAAAAPGTPWPGPRSGFQLALHADTLYLYGGYSKAADPEVADLEHGTVHDDMWALDLIKHTVRPGHSHFSHDVVCRRL